MPVSNPPAIVFGADVSALAVVRALGRHGVPVYVAGGRTELVGRSRWYRRAPGPALAETGDGERVAEYLRALPFPRAVLFPAADEWARALASLPEGVADAYPAAVASSRVLAILVDKARFADAAAEHSVPAPRTIPIDAVGDLDGVTEAELGSFFLKPHDSQLFARRYGVKALRLGDRAQAIEHTRRAVEDGLGVLLQEFVPGPPTAHVFVDGYVDREGAMRACLARRRLRMHPPEFGNSTMAVTMPLSEASEAIESLRRLFAGIGYGGLFDAEFKYDARDGRLKILEVNARPWWQLELAGACGLDLCVMAYRDALGLPLPPATGYRVGATWVHPLPDLRACWAARGSGDRAGGLPPRAWFGEANAVFSRDDPLPALDEVARLLRHVADAWAGGLRAALARARERIRRAPAAPPVPAAHTADGEAPEHARPARRRFAPRPSRRFARPPSRPFERRGPGHSQSTPTDR